MTTANDALIPPTAPAPEIRDAYQYPFAAAPDIIRSYQKDSYFQGVILEQFSDVLRNIYGARLLHKYSGEAKTFADLLYLSLTTLIGSRTLGEEYCDIVHVEKDSRSLPSITRRAGYIFTVVLLPYISSKILPKLRARIRRGLERRAARAALTKTTNNDGFKEKFFAYIRRNLDSLTGAESLVAVHLAIFYFSGAYYHASKRVWGLKYIFTKRILPHEQRVGYEVLGVLLFSQLIVQSYLHMSSLMSENPAADDLEDLALTGGATVEREDVKVSLENEETMGYVQGEDARKCTLCLELMKDPTLTPCGHMFCWTCIAEWCRSKPECPLCRSSSSPQHLLVLRG